MALLRISDIAAICQTPEAAVVAAAKILGYRRIGDCLALSKKPGVDFLREIDYHAKMFQAAEARRNVNLINNIVGSPGLKNNTGYRSRKRTLLTGIFER